jgi:hypothetical protein
MAGECNEIVEKVYQNPDLLRLISKIKPESIRDDLRQEIAVSLLEQPCDRITNLFRENNLLRYSMRVCWLMATSKQSAFYKRFRRTDLVKAVEYMRIIDTGPIIPEPVGKIADKAVDILSTKNKTVYDDHEARIFNKYVEIGSARKVAEYYNIPLKHVCNVVNKVKNELKCLLS